MNQPYSGMYQPYMMDPNLLMQMQYGMSFPMGKIKINSRLCRTTTTTEFW